MQPQESITQVLSDYKLELKNERRQLKGDLARTTCIITAWPLEERITAINEELRNLNAGQRFVGEPDEFQQVKQPQKGELAFWYKH